MINFFEVGGCIRDELLGLPVHDVDFSVEAPSFEAMRSALVALGFRIYVETPDKFTIRCNVPDDHPLRERTKDADFVLCRREGPYTDGRRPDWVKRGSRHDDQARRDFTVNSMAKDVTTGEIFDPFNGRADLDRKLIRFVGDPVERITEDGLRIVRVFRFMITKGFQAEPETWAAVNSPFAAKALARIHPDRIEVELRKMLHHDTVASIELLGDIDTDVIKAMFRKPLHLTPSQKQV